MAWKTKAWKTKAANSKKTGAVKVAGRTPHHSYDLKVRIEDISFGAAFKIWLYGLLISVLVFLVIILFFGNLFNFLAIGTEFTAQ